MYPLGGIPGPPCPVCGTPVAGSAQAPCPTCGLPAAGQAAVVVHRIGLTLDELSRDREALLATLRAAAGGPGRAAAPPPQSVPTAPDAEPSYAPAPPPPGYGPPPPAPPADRPAAVPPPPRRRLSPQQVLLGLGALLLVAGALAFVAVAWTRLGVAFQAVVMLVVTGAVCGASAWAARRGLRATEEALAAAGAALLAVDLGAAHALGLLGADRVQLRQWTAVSCLVVVLAGVLLGRPTRSTLAWPLVALVAAQPVALLLLSPGAVTGPSGVAALLGIAGLDVVALLRLRRPLAPVAGVLAVLGAGGGVLGGLALALGEDAADSWAGTGLLTLAGGAALAASRMPLLTGLLVDTRIGRRWSGRSRRLPTPAAGWSAVTVPAAAAGLVGIALGGSLRTTGASGPVLAAVLGLGLVTAVALRLSPRADLAAGCTAAGTGLALVGWTVLADAERVRPLSLLFLAATVPAATAAVRVPRLREPATGVALLAPVAALLLAREVPWLSAITAGLLMALVAALAFGLGALRNRAPEEWACALAGTVAGVAAARTTADVGAWGQLGLQLGLVGAAAGCYAIAAHRRPVAVVAVADLVLACWIAVAGAGVETPEAYTLPAAVGLLLVAVPQFRAGARSWAAEGAAVAVALVPSALVVVATPTALRLVLVVAAAVALTVVGTLFHRQAPFVLGASALGFVVVGRLWPYAPLLPRWVTLAAAGLVLLTVGATYERRRQQAREAVAWVAQMG